jgi:hypothetical protein
MEQEPAPSADTYQSRAMELLEDVFSKDVLADVDERRRRFLEESLEICQASRGSKSEAHQMVEYVFNRDVGKLPQEVGGTMSTLAALCDAHGLNLMACAESELARVALVKDKVRDKQKTKVSFPPITINASTDANYALQQLSRWEDECPMYSGDDPRASYYRRRLVTLQYAQTAIKAAVENGLIPQANS